MNFKLDENIGTRGLALLRSAGHDVLGVRDQALGGAEDKIIFDKCAAEQRALITLDRDFGQVLRFAPEKSSGIVILELHPRESANALLDRLRDFLKLLAVRPLKNELWIVEPGRVRVHQHNEHDP